MYRACLLKTCGGFLLALAFLVFLICPFEAQAKSFYFPEVRIEAKIERDGSFTVDEYRTYDFEGEFSWATLWIPIRVKRDGYSYQVTVEEFQVYDERDRPRGEKT